MRAAALALVGAVTFLTAVLAGAWPGRGVPVSAVGTIRMEMTPPAPEVGRAPSPAAATPSVRAVPRKVARTDLGNFPGAGPPPAAGSWPSPAGVRPREESGPVERHPRPWPDGPRVAPTRSAPPPVSSAPPTARGRGHGRQHGRPGRGRPTARHAP